MKPVFFGIFICMLWGVCFASFHKLFAQTDQESSYQEINDLSYVEGKEEGSKEEGSEKQKLNLVIPKGKNNFPLLLWIGGGAWSYVDRHMEMDLARKFGREGIAVASVGHRLSPALWKDANMNKGIQHPEHIKDIARAVKWLIDHAAAYGYSPQNIFVGGYSSGAHLAALLSMDERYLKSQGLSKKQIKGVIPIAGTYDIPHYYQILSQANGKQMADLHVKGVFGETHEDFIHASPTSYLKDMSVPMLLISETNTYRYTRFLEEKVKQAGFQKLEVMHSKELDHGGLWKNLSFEQQSQYRDLIIRFIEKNTTL